MCLVHHTLSCLPRVIPRQHESSITHPRRRGHPIAERPAAQRPFRGSSLLKILVCFQLQDQCDTITQTLRHSCFTTSTVKVFLWVPLKSVTVRCSIHVSECIIHLLRVALQARAPISFCPSRRAGQTISSPRLARHSLSRTYKRLCYMHKILRILYIHIVTHSGIRYAYSDLGSGAF